MISKITGGATERIFSSVILNKYEVDFFKCLETGFVQTEDPYWLEEAYSSALQSWMLDWLVETKL